MLAQSMVRLLGLPPRVACADSFNLGELLFRVAVPKRHLLRYLRSPIQKHRRDECANQKAN